jgi:restriction endonuclease S subunit
LASAAEKLSTGMAAISKFTLNPPRFWELTIPLPSMDEQIKIVKIFNEFCERKNEIIKASDLLAINYLELPKVTAYYLSKQYPYVQIRDIGKILRRNVKIHDDVSYKQVTIAMNNGGVRLREEKLGFEIGVKNQSGVKSGDLIFSRIDIRNGAIGFVPDYLEGAIVANDFPICELNHNVSRRFLNLYFKTNEFRKQCIIQSAGATNRKKMKRSNFLSLEVRFPDIDTQESIADRIDELNNRVKMIEQARSKILLNIEHLRNIFLIKVYEGDIF